LTAPAFACHACCTGATPRCGPFYREALRLSLDGRIGLEDGKHLPSGNEADSNAALIRAARALTA
jgi:uncharacterized protein (DUF849 family)